MEKRSFFGIILNNAQRTKTAPESHQKKVCQALLNTEPPTLNRGKNEPSSTSGCKL